MSGALKATPEELFDDRTLYMIDQEALTAHQYDHVPLGEIVTKLQALAEGAIRDCEMAHGECGDLIERYYHEAQSKLLAEYGLTRLDYEWAVHERLGRTRLAYDLTTLVAEDELVIV